MEAREFRHRRLAAKIVPGWLKRAVNLAFFEDEE